MNDSRQPGGFRLLRPLPAAAFKMCGSTDVLAFCDLFVSTSGQRPSAQVTRFHVNQKISWASQTSTIRNINSVRREDNGRGITPAFIRYILLL